MNATPECPVVVETPELSNAASITWQRILVPVDFTPASLAALKFAVRLAERDGSSLCLMHVVDHVSGAEDENVFYPAQEMGRQAERKLGQLGRQMVPPNVPLRILVYRGQPVRQIKQAAESLQCDLIVMAAHHRTGWQRLLTPGISHRVAKNASCHVFLVRPAVADQCEPTCWFALDEANSSAA